MLKKILVVAITVGLVLTGTVSNGAPKVNPYKPTSTYGDRCQSDKKIPTVWKAIAAAGALRHECESPFKIAPKSLPKAGPKTSLSPAKDFLNVDQCKIVDASDDRQTTFKGFPGTPARKQVFDSTRYPSAKTVFQIVPIEAPDAQAGNKTPTKDYSHFFKWLKDYLSYISEYGSAIEFRVPSNYIKFSKPLKPYGVTHGNRDSSFAIDALAEVDSQIDFTGANVILFVAPAGTLPTTFGQQRFNAISTQEGLVNNVGSAFPNTIVPGAFDHSIAPIWWLHELYHGGLNLDDGFGDQKWQDGPERGMGKWGLMSTGETEFLTWHKWLLGFTDDRQISCVGIDKATTTWIAPSSYRTTKTKMLVIPLSVNKAIVVESIRAAGLNYKLGPKEQGALAYVVDTTDRRHDFGFTVLRTESKAKAAGTSMNFQKTSPLYKGESITYEGVKITNVEWGEFGDVIKVEPVK